MTRKALLIVGALLLFVVLTLFASAKYNEGLAPPQIVANFVDLDKVKRISTFRSCAGHTTVPTDGSELKRNMKHYITLFPEHNKENFLEVYAPYDGHVALIFGGEEIWLAPQRKSLLGMLPINLWMFGVTHVKPRDDLKIGDKVKAREVIGYGTFSKSEPDYPSFDVMYGTLTVPPRQVDNWMSVFGKLDSVFNHMSTEVLAQYEKKGVTRENIIISKEERDLDPCVYRDGGPYFAPKPVSNDSVDLRK